jgi:hypothetical protein
MVGLVQLLVAFVVAWEVVELVLRHGLLLVAFKLGVVAALAAAAGCVVVLYVCLPLFLVFVNPLRTDSFVIQCRTPPYWIDY